MVLLGNRKQYYNLGIRIGALYVHHELIIRDIEKGGDDSKSELPEVVKAEFLKVQEGLQQALSILDQINPRLSEVEKLSIKVAAYLREEYPKGIINVNALYNLDER